MNEQWTLEGKATWFAPVPFAIERTLRTHNCEQGFTLTENARVWTAIHTKLKTHGCERRFTLTDNAQVWTGRTSMGGKILLKSHHSRFGKTFVSFPLWAKLLFLDKISHRTPTAQITATVTCWLFHSHTKSSLQYCRCSSTHKHEYYSLPPRREEGEETKDLFRLKCQMFQRHSRLSGIGQETS